MSRPDDMVSARLARDGNKGVTGIGQSFAVVATSDDVLDGRCVESVSSIVWKSYWTSVISNDPSAQLPTASWDGRHIPSKFGQFLEVSSFLDPGTLLIFPMLLCLGSSCFLAWYAKHRDDSDVFTQD